MGKVHPLFLVLLICVILRFVVLFSDELGFTYDITTETSVVTDVSDKECNCSPELPSSQSVSILREEEPIPPEDIIDMTGKPWPLEVPNCDPNQNKRVSAERMQEQLRVSSQKGRLVYYHIQHHAGTNLWRLAEENGECAPRICSQQNRHCLVSFKEEREASNLLETNITYFSYEVRLPKHFPLPFIDPTIRKDFYFMTIIRNPFNRLLSSMGHGTTKQNENTQIGYFWNGMKLNRQNKKLKNNDPYVADNLMLRWLAGIDDTTHTLSQHDINIAKCRLDLMDLVLTDQTIDLGLQNILCPLRGWKKCQGRGNPKKRNPATPFGPDNIVLNSDRMYLGAWIERHRPSFELYDYARALAVKTFIKQLPKSTPNRTEIILQVQQYARRKSYIETLERYMNITYGVWNGQKAKIESNYYYDVMLNINDDKMDSPNTATASVFNPKCHEIQKRYWSNTNYDDPNIVPNIFGIRTLS